MKQIRTMDYIVCQTTSKLAKKMLKEHVGRSTEVVLKRTGEKIKVIRDGYGPMEYPEKDPCHIKREDGTVIEFDDLYQASKWMIVENLVA